jgi:hypothetical protein
LVVKADLAENSAVRGGMVLKPYGYGYGQNAANLTGCLKKQVM